MTASSRRRKNTISKLRHPNGSWLTSLDDMSAHIHDYFSGLFQAINGDQKPIITRIQSRVTENDNATLTKPFSVDEFKEAVFSMHPDKSPGPDGLNPGFYQFFWDDIGADIFSSACSWLQSGAFPTHLNDTNIVLAPKGDHPETIKDLRPISLCNALYKIISKVLANRLRPLIGNLISPEQAAFVPSRSFMDNALSAFEILHHMCCRHKGNIGEVALKLDISKAFDSVN